MNVNFNKENGLVPVVVQDYNTLAVLMVGYMNEQALNLTLKTSRVTYYSRSKKRLWTKGEQSGNYLQLISIAPDCDNDTLLVKAKPLGPVCHKGTDTCWGETNEKPALAELEAVINDRIKNPKKDSYTNRLLSDINLAAQKVGEEAVELVIEAKDENDERFINEAADLMYHYLVLLAAKGKSLKEVEVVLKNRATLVNDR